MKNPHSFCLSRRSAVFFVTFNTLVNKNFAHADLTHAPSYFVLQNNFTLNSLEINKPLKNDLDEANEVLNFKYLRTEETISEIKYQDLKLIDFFLGMIDVSEAEKLELYKRLSYVLSDVADVVMHFKKIFNRPRPSEVLPEINPVLDVPLHRSYPSGHAAQAMVTAMVLSEWLRIPLRSLEIIAVRVGKNREIAGLHYPSDTAAGFDLGRQIYKFLI